MRTLLNLFSPLLSVCVFVVFARLGREQAKLHYSGFIWPGQCAAAITTIKRSGRTAALVMMPLSCSLARSLGQNKRMCRRWTIAREISKQAGGQAGEQAGLSVYKCCKRQAADRKNTLCVAVSLGAPCAPRRGTFLSCSTVSSARQAGGGKLGESPTDSEPL